MALTWRSAVMEDAPLLWHWANDAETRRNSFNKAPIPYDTHVAWLRNQLASPTTRLLIFADVQGPVGQVRFDLAEDVADVSITVAPERRAAGHGRAMLTQALAVLRDERGVGVRARARVLAGNARSLALFHGCGFVRVGADSRGGEVSVVLERFDVDDGSPNAAAAPHHTDQGGPEPTWRGDHGSRP